MNIKKFTGKINKIIDLSETAKEIHISLSEPIDFLSGSFVNLFLGINGEKTRRAYSISSSSSLHDEITLSIRLSPTGTVTPLFWNKNMIDETVELMGPLGLNTVDKMKHNKVYLFAFGVGSGVVKSVADYFANIKKVESLVIITGSRSEDEILYKEYFNDLAKNFENISVMHVVSQLREGSTVPKGYIQDHLDGFDFNNSDVYVCGQEKACDQLVEKVKSTNPEDCIFFIEAFH
ncbi:MAG: FAD-dependent oxidoreductase [Candidatus Nomurabacteria bacterium]|nr:FAD-dependent oxidoreductase [Candidatus Nomurabacteria bacterium]